jgi:outer membrane protein assembly factor BamB
VTGRPVWAYTYPARFFQWQGGEGPRATPTIDGDRVYAYGATGVLTCLDLATGTKVWSRDVLGENHLENLVWGVSASPLVFEGKVVVTGGETVGPTLFAYDCMSGQPLWKSGTEKASYSSPILATLAGRKVIVSVNAINVTVHDAANGEQLLSVHWTEEKWPKAAQPVILPNDQVFVSAGYGMGAMLFEVKAGDDGKLAATTLWKSLRMKTQFNSAAFRDGYLYGLDDGMMACIDAATGNRKWKDGHYGSGQTLLVDDLAIIQSEPGTVILTTARPERFQELGRIAALSSKTWNQPTLAGKYLLLRNDHEAVCYELAVIGK